MNMRKGLFTVFLLLLITFPYAYSQHLSTWAGTRIHYIIPDQNGGLKVYDFSKTVVAYTLSAADGGFSAYRGDSSLIFIATAADSLIRITDGSGKLLLTSLKNRSSGEEKIFDASSTLKFRSASTRFGGYYLYDASDKGLYFTIPDSYGNSGGSLYFYLLALEVIY